MTHEDEKEPQTGLVRVSPAPPAVVDAASGLSIFVSQFNVPFSEAELASIKDGIEKSSSQSTRTTYLNAWHRYDAWCLENNLRALAADLPLDYAAQVAMKYINHRRASGKSANTLKIDLAAINYHRKDARLEPVTKVREVAQFILGTCKTLPRPHKASAIMNDLARALADHIGEQGLLAIRDRAIILLVASTGMRRSELCELKQEHFKPNAAGGAMVHIWRSKTDQVGKGRDFKVPSSVLGEPYCAVEAVKNWIATSCIRDDPEAKDTPVFRGIRGGAPTKLALSGEDIRRIVKKRMASVTPHLPAHLRPAPGAKISPHSFRSGFITEGYINGSGFKELSEFTGHKDRKTSDNYIDKNALNIVHPLAKPKTPK
jgi:integrase